MRSLEREISKLCRKAVKTLLMDKKLKHLEINGDNLKGLPGRAARRLRPCGYRKPRGRSHRAGVDGSGWRSADHRNRLRAGQRQADLHRFPGRSDAGIDSGGADRGARAREKLGINADFYEKRDIHVHVPEGATPKDGPSAGIAMCTALVSCLTGNPVRADVAMTGEITLRGQVLPIGGLKEKLLAAHRGGIKTVLIPYENKRDLEEIPDNVIADLEIHPVQRIDEVLNIALQNPAFGALPVAAK